MINSKMIDSKVIDNEMVTNEDTDMLNIRIKILENTLSCPQTDLSIDQLVIQLNILETMASFYDNPESITRIQNIKEQIECRMGSVYSQTSCGKIDTINERIDRVLQNTDFINRCVHEQRGSIDQIELASSESMSNVQQAYNELTAYRKYQSRRKRFLRVIFILVSLLIVLILVKIFM